VFPVRDAGRSSEGNFGRAFRSEGRVRVGSERCSSLARPFGQIGGPESEASIVPPWPDILVREVVTNWVFGEAKNTNFLKILSQCVKHVVARSN